MHLTFGRSGVRAPAYTQILQGKPYGPFPRAEAASISGMKMFVALLSAILVAAGIFVLMYHNHETEVARHALEKVMTKSDSMSWTYANTKWTRGASTLATLHKAPEMSLAKAVTIKTPDGELTIPTGARVRVIEKSKLGMVAVNYQGYTAPIPADALPQNPTN